MKARSVLVAVFILIAFSPRIALAHCEIPCGIYDDALRVKLIREHITTIEKSMKLITELGAADEIDYNQLIRWTTNKDVHAEELQHIVWQYFMTQRIKPAAEGEARDRYVKQITVLHHLLIEAMKSKQTLDHSHIEKMRKLTDEFEKLYFEK
jgi:nickel superoxide dismutase